MGDDEVCTTCGGGTALDAVQEEEDAGDEGQETDQD